MLLGVCHIQTQNGGASADPHFGLPTSVFCCLI